MVAGTAAALVWMRPTRDCACCVCVTSCGCCSCKCGQCGLSTVLAMSGRQMGSVVLYRLGCSCCLFHLGLLLRYSGGRIISCVLCAVWAAVRGVGCFLILLHLTVCGSLQAFCVALHCMDWNIMSMALQRVVWLHPLATRQIGPLRMVQAC
jgi:hypothetical protein